MNEIKLIHICAGDDVAIAPTDLAAGDTVACGSGQISLLEDIPFGHKVALRAIAAGENVVKYGYPIGHADKTIPAGAWVHTHNLKTNLSGHVKYSYRPTPSVLPPARKAVFEGYARKDGRVGTRNEIWIIPTVGCVNGAAARLAKIANERFVGRVDGVFAYPHNMGCSQMGEDQTRTQRLLAGLVNHPNAGGALVLSLGCENNNLDAFKPYLGNIDPERVRFLVTQDVEDEYEEAERLIAMLVERAERDKRQTVPAARLTVGFKCGGSDAFSGVTANPLCGRVNDALLADGAATILTEVPEMFGAETLLMNRAVSREAFDGVVRLIDGFKDYYERYGQTIYENPSPGNKKGGISTLEEKSLGCVQKGGRAGVTGVLDYGQAPAGGGLRLLVGPGNDQVSCTNLTASGATVILFTTGRGNPLGAPVPTVKIATNNRLATRKRDWIDFSAGDILEGKSFDTLTDEFLAYLLDVASGRQRTKNESGGCREISIFRDGVIL